MAAHCRCGGKLAVKGGKVRMPWEASTLNFLAFVRMSQTLNVVLMYFLCLIFSKNLNTIQATEVAVDKKFKSFGSRLQETARKVKDMEMRIKWQDAILPENTEDCKALRNRIHDPGNQAQIKKCQVGRGSWKFGVRINWDFFFDHTLWSCCDLG